MSQIFTSDDLIIKPEFPRVPYRLRPDSEGKSTYWSHRKLFISTLQFLTTYWDPSLIPNPICVYVGASPAIHIPYLSRLFPKFEFHLYDTLRCGIKPSETIKLFKSEFTSEIAEKYKGLNNIFFISDLRSHNHKQNFYDALEQHGINTFDNLGNPIGDHDTIGNIQLQSDKETEKQIWDDMCTQLNWVLDINPEHALLKFRFPYSLDGKEQFLPYLKGIIYWQLWTPHSSTETRLKPVRDEFGKYQIINWSNIEYEQWTFYHNTVQREQILYRNIFFNNSNYIDYPNLLNDYDSMAEAFILNDYVMSQGSTDVSERYKRVRALSRSISDHLSRDRKQSISSKRDSHQRPSLNKYYNLPPTSRSIATVNVNRSWRSVAGKNTLSQSLPIPVTKTEKPWKSLVILSAPKITKSDDIPKDSLKISKDSLKISKDLLKIPKDSIIIPQDSIKISKDSTKISPRNQSQSSPSFSTKSIIHNNSQVSTQQPSRSKSNNHHKIRSYLNENSNTIRIDLSGNLQPSLHESL